MANEVQNKTVAMLEKYLPTLANSLPPAMRDHEKKLWAVTQMQIRSNPKLQACTDASLVTAVSKAFAYGLPFNTPEQECFVIPYKNVATFQLGYRGLLELAYRSGQVKGVQAHVVKEYDVFEVVLGLNSNLIHMPKLDGDRGKTIAYYCVIELEGGVKVWDWMSYADMQEHEKKFRKGGMTDAWQNNWDSMALKTVFIKTARWIPKSVEDKRGQAFHEALADERSAEYIDVPASPPAATSTDDLADRVAKKAEKVKPKLTPAPEQEPEPDPEPTPDAAPYEGLEGKDALFAWYVENKEAAGLTDKWEGDALIHVGAPSPDPEDLFRELDGEDKLRNLCRLLWIEMQR